MGAEGPKCGKFSNHKNNGPEVTMSTTSERRKRPRMALHWPVRLTRGTRIVESKTQNLSSGGFYCISTEAFAPGDSVECVFTLPAPDLGHWQTGLCLHCHAEVVRVEKTDPDFGFGLACRIQNYSLLVDGADRN